MIGHNLPRPAERQLPPVPRPQTEAGSDELPQLAGRAAQAAEELMRQLNRLGAPHDVQAQVMQATSVIKQFSDAVHREGRDLNAAVDAWYRDRKRGR